MSKVTLIASDPSRFDPLALDQLDACARYGGMARIVGLPDLHAGNGIAVDGSGNVYVAGNSTATWGSPVQAFAGTQEAFAAKLELAREQQIGGVCLWVLDGANDPRSVFDLTRKYLKAQQAKGGLR